MNKQDLKKAINLNAKHQQDMVMTDEDDCSRTLVCGSHLNSDTYTKIIVDAPLSKVKTLGNYSPSEHNASKIVDVDYSAPTVRENHGTVTAIVDDTYKSREQRVYDDTSPSLRAGRSGLKVANYQKPKVVGGIGEMKSNNNTQYYMQNRIYEGDAAVTVPANESFQPYYTTDAKVLGNLSREKGAKRLFNIYGENRGTGYAGNVWGKEYNAPSLTTMGGGNRQPMINGGTDMNDLRIRKLTPRECFRLMGVKDEDVDKLSNMSNSTLYHLAGDSIVTTVLMAIFGELLEVEWKGKVNNLHG